MLVIFTSVMEALSDTQHCISKANGGIWMKVTVFAIHIRSYQMTYITVILQFFNLQKKYLIKLQLRKLYYCNLHNISWVKGGQVRIRGDSSHCFPYIHYWFQLVLPIPN
jgi:hypothetical protein